MNAGQINKITGISLIIGTIGIGGTSGVVGTTATNGISRINGIIDWIKDQIFGTIITRRKIPASMTAIRWILPAVTGILLKVLNIPPIMIEQPVPVRVNDY